MMELKTEEKALSQDGNSELFREGVRNRKASVAGVKRARWKAVGSQMREKNFSNNI